VSNINTVTAIVTIDLVEWEPTTNQDLIVKLTEAAKILGGFTTLPILEYKGINDNYLPSYKVLSGQLQLDALKLLGWTHFQCVIVSNDQSTTAALIQLEIFRQLPTVSAPTVAPVATAITPEPQAQAPAQKNSAIAVDQQILDFLASPVKYSKKDAAKMQLLIKMRG